MDGPFTHEGHRWQMIAAGRICETCLVSQAVDEFDDSVVCAPRPGSFDTKPTVPPAPRPAPTDVGRR